MAQPTANDLLKKAVTPVAATPVTVQPPVVKKPVVVTPVVNKTPVAVTPVKQPILNAQKAILGYKKPALKDVSQPTTFSTMESLGAAAEAGTDWYNPWNDKQQSKLDYATSLPGKLEDANKRGLGLIDKSLGGTGAIGETVGSAVNTGLEFLGYGKALGLAGKAVAPLAKAVSKVPLKVAAAPYNALKNAAVKGGMARSAMAADMGAAIPMKSKVAGAAYNALTKVGNKAGAVTDAIGDTAFNAVGKVMTSPVKAASKVLGVPMSPANLALSASLATGYDAPKTVYDEDGIATNASFENARQALGDPTLLPHEKVLKFGAGVAKSLDEAVERNNPVIKLGDVGRGLSSMYTGGNFEMKQGTPINSSDYRIDEEKAANAALAAKAVSDSPVTANVNAKLVAAKEKLEAYYADPLYKQELELKQLANDAWLENHDTLDGMPRDKNTKERELKQAVTESQEAVNARAGTVQGIQDQAATAKMAQGSTAQVKTERTLMKKRISDKDARVTAADTAEEAADRTLAQEQVATEKEARTAAEVGKPLDNTPEGLAARYEAKRLEAETADKDFSAADALEEIPENYYLLQARSLERDKELRELKEQAGVQDAEPAFDENSPEFKAYSAKVDAFNAVADDDKVADEVKDKLEAEMNAAEKEVYPLYASNAPATATTNAPVNAAPKSSPYAVAAEAFDDASDKGVATSQHVEALKKAEASKFERTATGFADDKGSFVSGLGQDAKEGMFRKNDAYPTADKDYLDNQRMSGKITDKQYAAALAKGGALKTKGGTFSVLSSAPASAATPTEAPADPYAAIIQQLTNQMNNTGEDFRSRRNATVARHTLKDVLAQREQSMDRAQRETQAMREAAVRATEFDYRKGRDTTTDVRYEADRQHLYDTEKLAEARYKDEKATHSKERKEDVDYRYTALKANKGALASQRLAQAQAQADDMKAAFDE